MEPIRTYRTTLYGQEVTVKVYPADVSRPDSWVMAGQPSGQVDWSYLDEPETDDSARQRRAWEKVNPRDWEF